MGAPFVVSEVRLELRLTRGHGQQVASAYAVGVAAMLLCVFGSLYITAATVSLLYLYPCLRPIDLCITQY